MTHKYKADLETLHKLRKYTVARLGREKEQSLIRETLKDPNGSMTLSQSIQCPWLPLTRAQDRSGTLSFAFHPNQEAAEKLPASALPSLAGSNHGSQCSTSSSRLSKASSESSLSLQPRAQTAPDTSRCQQRSSSRLGSLKKSFESLELVGGEWRRKRPTTKNAMFKGGGEAWFTLT